MMKPETRNQKPLLDLLAVVLAIHERQAVVCELSQVNAQLILLGLSIQTPVG